MIVITSDEMRSVERSTIEKFDISEEILMERAGLSTVQAIWNEYGNLSDKNFLVICGTGNNGGDGYVVARDLLNYTEAVRVIAINEPKTDVAKLNQTRFFKHGGIIYKYDEIGLEKAIEMIASSDIVIDAIFGTGLKREITDQRLVNLIEAVNIYSNCTISVDIPSGVDTDTGKIQGAAVKAYLTVTFGFPKPGHLLYPGRDLTGKLKIAQIGIPSQIFSSGQFKRFLITSDVKKPIRPRWSHKKSFGEVIVIGGSKEYVGAPVLSALASQRAGAGMVKLIAPSEVCQSAMAHDPSLICYKMDSVNLDLIKSLISTSSEKSIIVVGPGWGQNEKDEKLAILRYLIRDIKNTLIIDADALNILSSDLSLLKEKRYDKTIVITPHPGEFSRLTGKTISEIKQNYIEAERFSSAYSVITILKDATTIVTDGNSTFFNISGNTSLSKAGSGDILSGIIAGLISQHLDVLESVKTGVYVFGLAGESITQEGFNSSFDVLNKIPEAFGKI
ncbi:MAG: NAD(P)H-hydrate dehydratase [Fervidobacterium sp.]|jgi:NAD(P)H-hydrate epimerase